MPLSWLAEYHAGELIAGSIPEDLPSLCAPQDGMREFTILQDGQPVFKVEGLSDAYRLVYRNCWLAQDWSMTDARVAGVKVGKVHVETGLYSVAVLGGDCARLLVGTVDEVDLASSPYEMA